MNRLVYFFVSLPILLSFIAPAHAGPACARRNQGSDACVQDCKDKWGWPGHVMGTDPWGSVLTKTAATDVVAAVTKGCRAKGRGKLGTASTTSIASSTSPLLIPPPSSTVAPANVIVSASVSTVTSATPSITLLPFTRSNSSTNSTTKTSSKSSFTAFIASTTAPPSTSSKPSTTSTPEPSTTQPKPSTTEAPPPPTTTTQQSSSPQPSATGDSSGGNGGNKGGDSNNNGGDGNNGSNGGNSGNNGGNNGNNGGDDGNNGNDGGNDDNGSSGGSTNDGATSQGDIDQYLSAHNSVRAQHGASPLSWSDDLAAKAQQWANGCVFEHSGGKLGPFGENLAAGTGSSYGIQSAVKSWTDEAADYNSGNPQPSHFTQVVWKATSQVGCAVQSCSGIFDASFGPAKYYVCEYSKQGNVIGQFAENVQA